MVAIGEGPTAVGVSDEVMTFFRRHGLERVGPGGGDETEDITVHLVPLTELRMFLAPQVWTTGLAVDAESSPGLSCGSGATLEGS